MSITTITGTYRENASPATLPRHECPDCHAVGSAPTCRTDCPRRTGEACALCGITLTAVLHTVPSENGGRECFYQQACAERARSAS